MQVKPKKLPSAEYLRECLDYNPESGMLTWRHRPLHHFKDHKVRSKESIRNLWNGKCAGKPALNCIDRNGYRVGNFDGLNVKAHRVIWIMETGDEPEFVDHINGVKSENRWANLRSVTWITNSRNAPLSSRNTSDVMGVSFKKDEGMWLADIGVGGRTHYLGIFKNKEDAIAARKAAEKELGFHPNHGRTKV